ncbi:hypothetical protein SFRURICE_006647 [Spodoptera frugiperda]|nr:hypothetical protein SFRURICE_006647 [Spodoptera frugiperda]
MSLGCARLQRSSVFMVVSTLDPGLQELQRYGKLWQACPNKKVTYVNYEHLHYNNSKELTVRALEVPMDEGHGRANVKHPEQSRLLQHTLFYNFDIFVRVLTRRLHRYYFTVPIATIHFPEAAYPDHFLQFQLGEGDARRLHGQGVFLRHVYGREYTDAIADLSRPPALIAGDVGVLGQHLDDLAATQGKLILSLCHIVVDSGEESERRAFAVGRHGRAAGRWPRRHHPGRAPIAPLLLTHAPRHCCSRRPLQHITLHTTKQRVWL